MGAILSAVAAPIIGGVVSSALGGNSSSGGQQAAAAADPFASQRPKYQEMLSTLMTDPSSFTMSGPGKFQMEQGMGATNANMAARGLSNSGAEATALTDYATNIAGKDYQQQLQNLMQMSGVGAGSPGAAGGYLANSQNSWLSGLNTFGNQVGNAVAGQIPGWMNGSGTDMAGFQSPISPPAYTGSPSSQGNLGTGTYNTIGSGGGLGSGTYTGY